MRLRAQEPAPALTIAEVERQLREIAAVEGRQARKRKLDLLRDLLVRATALEAKYLAKILIREMRHGMSEGVMLDAIAHATGAPIAEVRRINMMQGDPGRVLSVLRGGAPAPSPAPVSPSSQAWLAGSTPPPTGERFPPAADRSPSWPTGCRRSIRRNTRIWRAPSRNKARS